MLISSVRYSFFLLFSGLLLFSSQAAAQCLDPDGDGYGTNNGRPCRARRQKTITPDSGASLSILNQSVNVSATSADLNVAFSEAAKMTIKFGETSNLRKSGPYRFMILKQYSQRLQNLKPNTKYYYQIRANGRNHRNRLLF